ncbi:MAG: AarF/ABC1/UbiB kinase family protein [Proteobacteria bacterium]|nr:AarF/ABC1/UbiB kinase family protein [Pseudomonadota bacterium]MBU1715573.1 AarF/ABC1/UbiB kinase family protein [Pseudomonadota bacterium]
MMMENREKSLRIEEMIAALPDAGNTGKVSPEILADISKRISLKKMPTSALTRFWSLGNVQTKIALGYLAYRVRSSFVSAGKKQKLLNETHLAAAIRLLATMGYMRGAVMKLGQILANLPDVVPDEFAEILGALHFEAPPMHYSMIREVFVAEMGREPEEIFASFDKKAFAAASLGQVHKARLKTGEEVAVKIQYPHIARTIQADMRNLRFLLAPMRLSADWGSMTEYLVEIERVLTIEADYEQEAAFCRQAGKLFERAEGFVIPEIYDQYSSRRILTMEFIPGCHLQEFLAGNPSEELRNNYSLLISRFWARLFYSAKQIVADPHPGNFIFMADGRLGFIDFGCTRATSVEEQEMLAQLEIAFLEKDPAKIDQVIANACLYHDPSRMSLVQLQVIREVITWQFGPIVSEKLYDWGDSDFFLRGMELNLEMVQKGCSQSMPLCIWTNRMTYGFRAICYRLKCQNYFGRICREERERAQNG